VPILDNLRMSRPCSGVSVASPQSSKIQQLDARQALEEPRMTSVAACNPHCTGFPQNIYLRQMGRAKFLFRGHSCGREMV